MDKTSRWYNPDWKDYYCNSCGELYQFYVDGNCSGCRTHTEVSRDKEVEENKAFAEQWKAKKIKKKRK